MAYNRIDLCDEELGREGGEREVQPIGEILEELLAQYQVRFPELNIAIMETAAAPV